MAVKSQARPSRTWLSGCHQPAAITASTPQSRWPPSCAGAWQRTMPNTELHWARRSTAPVPPSPASPHRKAPRRTAKGVSKSRVVGVVEKGRPCFREALQPVRSQPRDSQASQRARCSAPASSARTAPGHAGQPGRSTARQTPACGSQEGLRPGVCVSKAPETEHCPAKGRSVSSTTPRDDPAPRRDPQERDKPGPPTPGSAQSPPNGPHAPDPVVLVWSATRPCMSAWGRTLSV